WKRGIVIDISPADLDLVKSILARHVQEFDVLAFGSRLAHSAKPTSDLDLVIRTTTPLSLKRMAFLKEAFDESDLPFKVDIVDWSGISGGFRKIIEHTQEIIQTKSSSSSQR